MEIGIPEEWWREANSDGYKKRLAEEVEAGLRSMIDVLQAKKRRIDSEALLNDWHRVKNDYLSSSTKLA